MSKFLITYCCLLLFSVGITSDSYAIPLSEMHEDCYPITYFATLKKAVAQYKRLTDSSIPVLVATWLPFQPISENVRIEGCGTILKTEYIGNNQKVRIHVYPQMDKLRVNHTLSDATKAEYMENDFFYVLRFNKQGRSYMIHIDKKNVNKTKKDTAMEFLVKISNSLNAADGY